MLTLQETLHLLLNRGQEFVLDDKANIFVLVLLGHRDFSAIRDEINNAGNAKLIGL